MGYTQKKKKVDWFLVENEMGGLGMICVGVGGSGFRGGFSIKGWKGKVCDRWQGEWKSRIFLLFHRIRK